MTPSSGSYPASYSHNVVIKVVHDIHHQFNHIIDHFHGIFLVQLFNLILTNSPIAIIPSLEFNDYNIPSKLVRIDDTQPRFLIYR